MASASLVCHLGLLHMRPLQLWLKSRVPWRAWSSAWARVVVTHSCLSALKPWQPEYVQPRGPLGAGDGTLSGDDGYVFLGLGCGMQGHGGVKSLVIVSGQLAHKSLEAEGCVLSSASLSVVARTAACTDSH